MKHAGVMDENDMARCHLTVCSSAVNEFVCTLNGHTVTHHETIKKKIQDTGRREKSLQRRMLKRISLRGGTSFGQTV